MAVERGQGLGDQKVVWQVESVSKGSPARTVLTHVSPDGDGGCNFWMAPASARLDAFIVKAMRLESQVFPDAPNHADFPSARLDPGKTYVNTMVFRFSTGSR